MNEHYGTLTVLLVILIGIAPVATRTCYSSNSLPMNYNHDYRANSECLPCYHTCAQCPSATTRDCGANACEAGYYYSNSTCRECSLSCRSCNTTSCLICWSGYYLSSGICIACSDGAATCSVSSSLTCRPAFFYDSSSLSCLKCLPNCSLCRNSQSCDSCATSFYYSPSQLSCNACAFMCLTCSQQSVCDVCVAGTYRSTNGTCVNYTMCSVGCLECPNSTCSLCMKGYYTKNGTCVQGTSSLCKLSIGPDFGSCLVCEI